MRTVAVILLLVGMPWASDAQTIEGRWKLLAAEDLRADGTVVRHPWGRNPVGSIVVDRGWCYVQIMSSDVPAFIAATPIGGQMSAMLLSSYIAYSGACTIDEKEGSVTLKVDAAWRPGYVGTEQKRFFRILGDRMFFGPAPNSIRAEGGNLSRRLTLERQLNEVLLLPSPSQFSGALQVLTRASAELAIPAAAHATRCKVAANACTFGEIGVVAKRELFYVLERAVETAADPYPDGHIVILDRAAGASEPLRSLLQVSHDPGLYQGDRPALVTTPYGLMLKIPVALPGTGNFNEDVILQWQDGHWLQIESRQWMSDFKLPPCYAIWKGQSVNLKSWQATSAVWVAGDSNCCPSGGEISGTLELRDRAIRVREQKPRLVPIAQLPPEVDRNELKACLAKK